MIVSTERMANVVQKDLQAVLLQINALHSTEESLFLVPASISVRRGMMFFLFGCVL